METNRTEIAFILDRSGSMSGLEADTIGGYNAMLKKQKEEPDEAIITTVLFDNNYQLLHDRINIKGVRPITEKDYYVGGSTALLDAIGRTIDKIANVQRQTSEDLRADRVLFVITTDGMENASREYTYEKIKGMIEHQKEKYRWEFLFLGANIDAIASAARMGIHADMAVNYNPDGIGTQLNYAAVSDAISDVRSKKQLSRKWKEGIERDYENRGN